MGIFWPAKASGATINLTWEPALAEGDSIASITPTMTGAVLEATDIGDGVVNFVVSGGTTGQTAILSVTITTAAGEDLVETIYLPIIGPGVLAETVQDIVSFALRKVTGIGEDPSADQAGDALERLQDMLDTWRITGADVGAPSPLALTSVVYCPDGYLRAIKNNLIVQLADLYGFDLSPVVVQNARNGLYMIKQAALPEDRPGVYY